MTDTFYPIFGGGFYSLIEQWQQYGVFTVLLPLILIFSIVFAILEKINILNNQGVHLVIALAIGFFTVANPYISAFFVPLFSNLAIGIAIMVVLLILIGIALGKNNEKAFPWIFGIPGFIIFLVVLARTGMFKLMFGDNIQYWIAQNSHWISLFILIVIVLFATLAGVKNEQGETLIERLIKKK